MQNFGFRSGTIGAAAGKTDRTSGTSMLRAMPAYIYTGFRDFENPRYFRK